jgi:hypothetical protein
MILTGGHISKLILDYCVHLSDSKEYSSRKLVLVVDGQPFVKHLADAGLQDLGDWER